MITAVRDDSAAPARLRGQWLKRRAKWLIILPPLLFLLVFFLIPFGFALTISFADTAVRVPPFTDILSVSPDWHIHLTLNLGNFKYLFSDEVYGLSYLYSLKTAFFSTLICLAIGYPMAYGIARTSKSTQSILLLIIILPFWTSFLLRVYALEGIIRETGLLNTALLWLGVIDHPLQIMRTTFAVYLGIIYSYLPFMVLPLFATLEKLDHSLLEAAARLGQPAMARLPRRDSALVRTRDHRRLHAGVHPGDRRIRHSDPARRSGQSDDRPRALGRILRQSRLAGRLRRGHRISGAAGRPDRPLPALQHQAARGVGVENRISPFLVSILCIGIAVLYIPILVLIGYSFNASALVSVWGGFSTSWYSELVHNDQILDAAWLRSKIGVVVSTGAVILGTLAAISLVRFKVFRGRLLLTGMVNAPLVMPEIITGITQLLLFVSMLHVIGWPHRGFTTIVIAHIAFCSAYVTVTVQSRLASADRSLEEAAMDLGSGPVRAFIDTTLPGIAPALASSWLLSFTLSLDDLVISSFVSGPGASTLPMVIFSKVKLGVSPDINALASLMICLVGACVLLAGYLMRRAERQRVLDAQMAER